MEAIEERKVLEAEFHDKLRDPSLAENPELFAKLTANRKWYSVVRSSWEFFRGYLQKHSKGAVALDFASGDGICSFVMAESGANVIGIDISPTSVRVAENEAERRGLKARFEVMDCENMTFPASSFDLISVSGVLHHMDLSRAYPELARVLKPEGSIVCAEALAHNPVFHAYRKLTPNLRTEFEAEHILRRCDVLKAKDYFNHVEMRFFHFFTLMAVPFRNTKLFNPLLSVLERVDAFLLNKTPLRWWAWQVLFVLSGPKADSVAGAKG